MPRAILSLIVGLKSATHVSILGAMKVHTVFAILIAAAMLLAPLAIRSGAAMAMAPSAHPEQTIDKGHCSGQAGQPDGGQDPGDTCCAAMCNGLAVAAAAPVEAAVSPEPLLTVAPVADRHGVSAKLPTPPPRLS